MRNHDGRLQCIFMAVDPFSGTRKLKNVRILYDILSLFQVITPFRNLILCSDSRREMEEWISALKMAANKEYYEVSAKLRFRKHALKVFERLLKGICLLKMEVNRCLFEVGKTVKLVGSGMLRRLDATVRIKNSFVMDL